jgi:hypothetical protein
LRAIDSTPLTVTASSTSTGTYRLCSPVLRVRLFGARNARTRSNTPVSTATPAAPATVSANCRAVAWKSADANGSHSAVGDAQVEPLAARDERHEHTPGNGEAIIERVDEPPRVGEGPSDPAGRFVTVNVEPHERRPRRAGEPGRRAGAGKVLGEVVVELESRQIGFLLDTGPGVASAVRLKRPGGIDAPPVARTRPHDPEPVGVRPSAHSSPSPSPFGRSSAKPQSAGVGSTSPSRMHRCTSRPYSTCSSIQSSSAANFVA